MDATSDPTTNATSDPAAVGDERRLLETLQRLLGIASPELRPALDQASDLVAGALGADKVDVFLHEAATDTPDRWAERDLRFLTAVAGWVGMLTHRAELSEELARQAERRGERKAVEELARLTRRQRELAACVAEGLSNAEIA